MRLNFASNFRQCPANNADLHPSNLNTMPQEVFFNIPASWYYYGGTARSTYSIDFRQSPINRYIAFLFTVRVRKVDSRLGLHHGPLQIQLFEDLQGFGAAQCSASANMSTKGSNAAPETPFPHVQQPRKER
jgi:hypothetical protein